MLKRCERAARDTLKAFLGSRDTWGATARARQQSADVHARLQDVLARVRSHPTSTGEQPVFLLSAGWRSGSTLLQRMIMEHNQDVLLWGEPFAHSAIPERMLGQLRAFTPDWPLKAFFLSELTADRISDAWSANLYPDVDDLLEAHRNFFRTLYAAPATRVGHKSWGFKAVRSGIEHAAYFRVLFPECKIIFLYRNPYDAYLSYRSWDSGWFMSWPDHLVSTPHDFGRCWAALTRGYLEGCETVDGVLIRYEDLDKPEDVARLQAYLGWPVPRQSEMRRISMHEGYRPPEHRVRKALPTADRLFLSLATRGVRQAAGYT